MILSTDGNPTVCSTICLGRLNKWLKKASKLCVTGHLWGETNSGFCSQRASNADNALCHIYMWVCVSWRKWPCYKQVPAYHHFITQGSFFVCTQPMGDDIALRWLGAYTKWSLITVKSHEWHGISNLKGWPKRKHHPTSARYHLLAVTGGFPSQMTSNAESILIHWGRVTHICINKLTIIASDNGLLPGRHQAIIWTNVGKLLIGPLGTSFSEIFIKIHIFSL